jgi:hypothetical protein
MGLVQWSGNLTRVDNLALVFGLKLREMQINANEMRDGCAVRRVKLSLFGKDIDLSQLFES